MHSDWLVVVVVVAPHCFPSVLVVWGSLCPNLVVWGGKGAPMALQKHHAHCKSIAHVHSTQHAHRALWVHALRLTLHACHTSHITRVTG